MEDPLFAPSTLVQRRLLVRDKDGNPTLAVVPLVTKAVMQDLHNAAAAMPYASPEPDPLHPDHFYDGMSCAEVMVRKRQTRAAFTGEDVEPVLDRLMGKPKQTSESLRINVTYEERIKQIAKDVSSRAPIDAEVME